MIVDLDVILMTAGGAGLLIAGGALLRSGTIDRLRRLLDGTRAELDEAVGDWTRGRAALDAAHAEADSAKAEIGKLKEERDGAANQRQALSEELTRTKAELEVLVEERRADQLLVTQMEVQADETRAKLHAAGESVKSLTAELEEAQKKAKAPRPVDMTRQADQAALTSARNELAEARKTLATITQERDAARAKSEAVERTLEGVRARSRDLKKELDDLKAGKPGA